MEAILMVAFTVVRLGIPIAVLAVIGYLVYRADRLQQAPARPALRLVSNGELVDGHGASAEKRCWEKKGCSPAARESCPAYHRPEAPCWLACMQASPGHQFKPACLGCELFSLTSSIA